MSVSVTTKSKTMSSNSSESIEDLMIEDRWTNNINYRQLVISSSIGIFQFCWHPYIHDLKRLLPFLLLHNIFSWTIAYPVFYLELAIAAMSRKGVLNCWDMSPLARGIGFAMLSCCMFTALAASVMAARCLALLVHSVHSFLPWLHCAAAASPPCAARHRPLPDGALTPAHSFYYNFVLNFKNDNLEGGLGNVVWELATYYLISWLLIYFIAIKRIYSYSKLVLFKDVLAFFVLLSCVVGVYQLNGATDVFHESNWNTIFEEFQIWREAIEYSLVELSVSQGSIVMLGALCPSPHKLGHTALSAQLVSKLACMTSALILAGTYSALRRDYDGKVDMMPGSATAMILWSDFVARVPGSQFWSALVFFTLFVLSVTTAALLVQTMMSSLTGRSLRRITWAFLLLICVFYSLIGAMTLCTQGGQYLLDFIIRWPVSMPRLPIAATVTAVITYLHGQTTFCENLYFTLGEYPNVFVRVCWAVMPLFLGLIFALGMGVWQPIEAFAGWMLVAFTILPIAVVMCLYMLFKCRVRNIVSREK